MIGLLLRLGMSERIAKLIAYVGLPLLLIGAIFWWHNHAVSTAFDNGRTEGRESAFAEVEAKAKQVKAKADAITAKAEQLQTTITNEERTRADDEARHIAADADALRRVRPSGALQCRPADPARVPGSPGRQQAPGRPGDAALVAVDWQWLVDRAEQADLNRAEVLTWRGWYDRQRAAYEEWRADWVTVRARR